MKHPLQAHTLVHGPLGTHARFGAAFLPALLFIALLLIPATARAQNAIVTENQQQGTPASQWDITGIGDPTIQGFATDISYNRGEVARFKIKTAAAAYGIDIYRLGYYGGDGARLVGSGTVTATLPQSQPADLYDPVTGLTDCGNWAESAHWSIPANAVSGIYIARLVRGDTQGASHIVFIVRDDSSSSDLLFQTSDATWQAYNGYGGNSLYLGSTSYPSGHAAKVSYNRPFFTRGGGGGSNSSEDWLFNAEYPMVRWLEANGYDVTYTTNVDTDRRGSLILRHKVFLSVGHDEYWSAGQRANVTAARDSGVHLAFFSGNEVYWKTRWETSIDGSGTPHRTLVCYKEGTIGENVCGGKCDPLSDTWTGLWRDGCLFTPPADGCAPENALTGQMSWYASSGAIRVPDTYKDHRFWRNTSITSLGSGQAATLTPNSIGYEWDWQQYPNSYPAGRMLLSDTFLSGRTHHLSLYRHTSGALVFGAGTVQWSWGLDGEHDRGGSTPSTEMRQATVNLFADMGVQPGSLQGGLVPATASTDAAPAASTITFPAPGASLDNGVTITVAGTASDAGGVVAGVEVSVDGGTTWRRAVGTTSWTFEWTPATLGAATILSRGFDDTGNMEAAGTPPAANAVAVNVVPPPPPSCPCTIFPPGAPTLGPLENDGTAIEVGVKFRSIVDGYITGLRFYKASGNIGTHTGQLWSGAGALLATATFAGETASGWQEVTFPVPVAITAGTTYVASYHSAAGWYSESHPYFTTALVSGPLRALADGEDGPNGVYSYSATPAFPEQTFQSSNYWVDVVFNTTIGPDETPPVVTQRVPAPGAGNVPVGSLLHATFNEALDPATANSSTVELRGAANVPVPAAVQYDSTTRTISIDPVAALANSSLHTVTLRGGEIDPRVKDIAGNALAADVTWSFTTMDPPPPPPDEGPGGPVLVISAATNPFSRYFVEILRAEGLNAFSASDISLVTPAVLNAHSAVILGEFALTAPQVTMLTDWVNAGGLLIASRPDAQLAGLLGLTVAGGTLANAYLAVNTASGPGAGIVGETIQFHGSADLYTLNGATSLATLYSNPTTATANPAVTWRSVGANGGRAAAFTFDLARSIVYTRQGNPAWSGQKRDGEIEPIRSDDMFFGNAAFDPQPDWVNLDKVAIPQADEQQRLLANMLTEGVRHRLPLPRFWYLPRDLKAAIVMGGDNHISTGIDTRFEVYRAQSPPDCSLEDWECVRATGYIYLGPDFTDSEAAFYDSLGFEVALHINSGCARTTQAEYEAFVTTQLPQFAAAYPSIPLPQTNRNHCIAFSDWSQVPEVEAANGIRFDTNYYYWPAAWVQNRPGMFTGSGFPMRFAKMDGTIIDCYQATTQMPDEAGMTFPAFCDSLLDRALGPKGYYGVFTANMHLDRPVDMSDQIVASALARGVPVVSSKQMLDWIDGRNGSTFDSLRWNADTLRFSIDPAPGSRNLRAMLPLLAASGELLVLTRDGLPVARMVQTVKGQGYAFFDADSGDYVAVYGVDTAPPVIGNITVTPFEDGTATIEWTTDEASDSRVDYGTSPGSLTLFASDTARVTSHVLTLTGLSPNTTHHFRVTSADEHANSATAPQPPAAPLSFVTPPAPCLVDDTAAQLAAGTADAGIRLTIADDGEFILKPAAGAEFTVLPPVGEWDGFPWSGGGSATVSGGRLVVDGARFNSEPAGTTYGPGTSLEFVATFGAAPFQYAGFGAGADLTPNEIYNTYPIAAFGTGGSGASVITRVWPEGGGSFLDFTIPQALIGSAHRYRIVWGASSFEFHVDGALVHTEAVAVAGPMRPAISDFTVGGPSLAVDWIRVSPYAASGSYTSRVYDAGVVATWGAMTWTADVPAGSSLQMFARRGGTPVPDATWTAFTAVPVSGTPIGGATRYIQYRADLARTTASVTPEVGEVRIACSTEPDGTPPVITAVTATPGADGVSATVQWSTDEFATSRVDYGTDPGALNQNVSDAELGTAHSLALAGLAPSTTYHYRVTSADVFANSATDPQSPAPPRSFTTSPLPCPSDQTVAQFALGTTDAGTAVSGAGDGEVILRPAAGSEFDGATLPAGWQSSTWNPGGTAVVGGGALTVDGAQASTTAGFGPGRSLEFVATFQAATFQNVGWVTDAAFTAPWVVIGQGSLTDGVYARTSTGLEVLLSSTALGTPHRYRIDWNAGNFVFHLDGAVVTTIPVAIGANLVPIVSDFNVGGVSLGVDWLRVTPYASSGTFHSRVFDGGGPTTWGALTWTASTPAGTSLSMSARTGGTPVPDGTWSPFDPMTNGQSLAANSRYVQYRAELATSVAGSTPALQGVQVACLAGPDLTPPVIANVSVVVNPDGVSATVTWTTDERSTSRADYGLDPGLLTQNVSDPAMVRNHTLPLTGLAAATKYHLRVTSADPAANDAVFPAPPAVPLSFTTPLPACFVDQSAADFAAGTAAGIHISTVADGEVILAPGLGAEFTGAALPAELGSVLWSDGSPGGSTVSGGQVTVDGGRLAPVSTTGHGAGRALEFVATFATEAFQNVGFGSGDNTITNAGMFGDVNQQWVMFSTGASAGPNLLARVNPGGDVNLGPGYLGAPHRFRIEWRADSVVFLIDGASVDRRAAALAGPMRAGASDFNAGGGILAVDWLRMTPFAASGQVESRVHDAGTAVRWGPMSWNAVLPAGTGLAMAYRSGASPVPDGTWTAFTPVAAPGTWLGAQARYIQYRAQLSTANPDATPELLDVSLACCTDETAPPAIVDLAAERLPLDSNADGTRAIRLTFTLPGDGVSAEVYRAAFGNYPEYDDAPDAGSTPPPPSYPPDPSRWTLTGVTSSGDSDEVGLRDFFHYAVFARDACGNLSAVSNVTTGTLNYILGDVHDGLFAHECTGNNVVFTEDVSYLGASYGAALGVSDARACLDVGPTSNGSTSGRPLTDNALDFEDLIVFALNYSELPGLVLAARPAAPERAAAGADALALDPVGAVISGENFTVTMRLSGTGRVHGFSAQLAWDPAVAEIVAVQPGGMAMDQGALVLTPGSGRVDAARLGGGTGLVGEGVVAEIRFRALASGDPAVRIAGISARDGANRSIAFGAPPVAAEPALPGHTRLGFAAPNPFQSSLSIQLSVARAQQVKLRVYDVSGRLVRRLIDGEEAAGSRLVRWDGRDDRGRNAAVGMYVVRLEAGDVVQSRRVQLVR